MLEYLHTADGRLRVWDTFRDVTPEALFRYWVEPDTLERWWPDEATLDPVPGGRYRYTFAKVGHTLAGTFTEVQPGQRLAFSWRWEHGASGEQHVVTDFERRDNDVLLTLTQGPYETGEAGERKRQQQFDDWRHVLGRLKTLVRQTPG